MIFPKYLKQESKIAIISPSGYINKDFIFSTRDHLLSLGFTVSVYPSSLNRYYQFAGTDEERLADIQSALDDETVEAILCSRGGYGLIRIIDKLDFSKFIKNPKWVIGFSDITNLHLAINKLNIISIHSQMAKAIYEDPESKSVTLLMDTLVGNIPNYKVESHNLNIPGNSEAELIGGNLSIIYSLQGTKLEIETDNKILFIEDLNEYLYHLDRIMLNLKLSGKLKNLKGLIVGSFTDMLDNQNPFGKNAYEIIHEHIVEYGFPVCFDFPSGHIKDNYPLIIGMKYKLEINQHEVMLSNIHI